MFACARDLHSLCVGKQKDSEHEISIARKKEKTIRTCTEFDLKFTET